MTQSLRYEFIGGGIDSVRRAWQRFEATQPEVSTRAVHFVPASGGCFVVMMPASQQSALSLVMARRLFQGYGLADELHRFKDFLGKSTVWN